MPVGPSKYDYLRCDTFGIYDAGYDGNTLYASAELVKPIHMQNNWVLLPLVGVDYQVAWTDGFAERGTGASAQVIDSANLDQLVIRTGLNSKVRMNCRFDLNARLQYGCQIAGKTYGSVNSVFASAPSSPVMNLRGVDLGRNQLNTGVGFQRYFGTAKRAYLFGDYAFDCGERTTAHTGQVGLICAF